MTRASCKHHQARDREDGGARPCGDAPGPDDGGDNDRRAGKHDGRAAAAARAMAERVQSRVERHAGSRLRVATSRSISTSNEIASAIAIV